MAGLDEYARFYWTVDAAGNSAIASGESIADYPSMDSGQYASEVNPVVSGEFGVGYRFYSYDPLSVPTRVSCWYAMSEPENIYADPGFSSLFFGDYTFDFWLKINPGASGEQPILTCQNGWELFYNNGEIGQQLGVDHRVSCYKVLSGEYHHIEINRIGSTNNIFVDGVWQPFLYNTWNPGEYDQMAGYSWYFGVTDNSLRNVDYSIDEFRVSSGIGRHLVDFTPPTEPYTFLIEESSPTSGEISLSGWVNQEISVYDYSGEASSPTNGRIWLTQHFGMSVTLEPDYPMISPTDGRIRFEGLTELQSGFYGLTIPAITDGTITFDGLLELDQTFETDIEPIFEGVVYNLGSNAIELPAALVTAPVLDLGTWVPPTFTFNFLNALVMDVDLILLNALNTDVEMGMEFWNAMTEQLIVSLSCPNKLLALNEIELDFHIRNRLISDTGSFGTEVYEGFYFSKIHGA